MHPLTGKLNTKGDLITSIKADNLPHQLRQSTDHDTLQILFRSKWRRIRCSKSMPLLYICLEQSPWTHLSGLLANGIDDLWENLVGKTHN